MKIEKIEIKNFRGIGNNGINIRLAESNIVLIYAPNGFGKTSIIDSIEWGLTGNISHLNEISTVDKKRFNKCQMINFFSGKEGKKTNAEIKIIFDNGEKLTRKNKQTQKGDFDGGELDNESIFQSLLRNKDNEINFCENFYHTHMLGQDTINSFLCNQRSEDREKKLFNIIGIDRYNKLFDSIKHGEYKLQTLIQNINKYTDEIETLKESIENCEPHKVLIETEFKSFEDVNDFIFNIQHNLTQQKEVIDNIDENILSKITNKDIEVNEKYENITNLLKLSNNKLEELKKINEKIDKSIEIREKIKEIDELYIKLQDFISFAFIDQNIDILNKRITEEKKISRYNNQFQRIKKIKKKFREINDKVMSNVVNIKYFRNLEILEAKDIDKLKELIQFFEANFKIDSIITKSLIKEYINIKKEYARKLETETKLRNNIAKLGKVRDEIIKFYSVNVKFVEDNKDNINKNKRCPLCNSEVTADAIISNIKKILDINDSSYDEMKKSIDIINNEIKNLLIKLKDIKKNMDLALDTILKIVEDTQQGKNQSIINIESIVVEKLKAAKIKKDIEVKKQNKIKKHIEMLIKRKYFTKIDEVLNKQVLAGIMYNIRVEVNKKHKMLIEKEILPKEKVMSELIDSPEFLHNFKQDLDKYDPYQNRTIEEINSNKEIIKNKFKKISSLNKYIKDSTEKISLKIIRQLEKYEKLKISVLELQEKNNKLVMIKSIIESIQDSSTKTNEKIIKKYILDNKLVHQIYKNINPHPIHKDINIESSNGLIFKLNNEFERVQADYIFSSAQKNVLALSIFLGFAFQQSWSNLDQIFIDDPIQNMDDINVVGFVDILRNLFSNESKMNNKTIVLTTHDEKFRNLVKMKFRHLKVREYCIESYDMNGPIIKETEYM
ncbi:hypothetical protein D2A34_23865 [Clostridium chromiireducens]|uniref:Nuclease SbcCD subunit C n=1 Tax=Clostridium chromiireducens TaxID=225345 RepID=A0A399IH47_9CLOT|nr:AAA family ATPase [Clostridium chromiireducens]RII32263.1 hypothetical protein D2A34_23865 [Clostridium chromiireducens]